MKIVRWVNDPFSAINGIALIEVEPNEVADIDQMLIIVDGDTVGHFGVSVTLKSIDNPPVYKRNKEGILYSFGDFGFPRGTILKQHKRYYQVHVNRD